jgi:IS30 family transposase
MNQLDGVRLVSSGRIQYSSKRTDLSGYSQSELDKVAARLNQRPRKTLGFDTRASRLRASVAPTH